MNWSAGLCSEGSTRALPEGLRVFRALDLPGPAPRAVVAIPVRDEAAWLPACLAALKAQVDGTGRPISAPLRVLLLVNNCRDASFAVATSAAQALGLALSLREVELPPPAAHVGWARRLAMEAAARLLGRAGTEHAVILSTDADSEATPGWLDATLRAIRKGADAVAGAIVPHAGELRRLDPRCRTRLLQEHLYHRLLDRLATLVDPEPHDPWPRHPFHCGASMAVRLSTYLAVGGLPPVPLAEDRAFFAAIQASDGRIRHCPEVRVHTSCRVSGRAAGGMAATLQRWSGGPAAAGDEIEAAASFVRAMELRAELRAAHGGAPHPGLAARLGLSPLGVRHHPPPALLRRGPGRGPAALPVADAEPCAGTAPGPRNPCRPCADPPALRRRRVRGGGRCRADIASWRRASCGRTAPPRRARSSSLAASPLRG